MHSYINAIVYLTSPEPSLMLYSHEQIRQHVKLLIIGMGLVAEYFVPDYFLNKITTITSLHN